MKISLVTTVFNEAKRIQETINDINNQSFLPAEVIIVDAGSKDGTIEIINNWKNTSSFPIHLFVEKGCNVAEGRNLAIKNAKYDLIVSTDFGCRFHAKWIESLVKPFYSDPDLEVTGGAFSVLFKDINSLAAKSDYILQNGYQVKLDEYFSVSSRSIAYKKHVWEKTGGYPEWLTLAADDTIFWKMIRKHQFKYLLVDSPYVYWMRHQSNKAFGKEAFRYGLGDGESKINYKNFFSLLIETGCRYLLSVYILFLPILIVHFPLGLAALPILMFGLRPYKQAYFNWIKLKAKHPELNGRVFLNCLVQIEGSRFNYIKGYLKGLWDKDPEVVKGKQLLWENLG